MNESVFSVRQLVVCFTADYLFPVETCVQRAVIFTLEALNHAFVQRSVNLGETVFSAFSKRAFEKLIFFPYRSSC